MFWVLLLRLRYFCMVAAFGFCFACYLQGCLRLFVWIVFCVLVVAWCLSSAGLWRVFACIYVVFCFGKFYWEIGFGLI